jgi:hypothetical protein
MKHKTVNSIYPKSRVFINTGADLNIPRFYCDLIGDLRQDNFIVDSGSDYKNKIHHLVYMLILNIIKSESTDNKFEFRCANIHKVKSNISTLLNVIKDCKLQDCKLQSKTITLFTECLQFMQQIVVPNFAVYGSWIVKLCMVLICLFNPNDCEVSNNLISFGLLKSVIPLKTVIDDTDNILKYLNIQISQISKDSVQIFNIQN